MDSYLVLSIGKPQGIFGVLTHRVFKYFRRTRSLSSIRLTGYIFTLEDALGECRVVSSLGGRMLVEKQRRKAKETLNPLRP